MKTTVEKRYFCGLEVKSKSFLTEKESITLSDELIFSKFDVEQTMKMFGTIFSYFTL